MDYGSYLYGNQTNTTVKAVFGNDKRIRYTVEELVDGIPCPFDLSLVTVVSVKFISKSGAITDVPNFTTNGSDIFFQISAGLPIGIYGIEVKYLTHDGKNYRSFRKTDFEIISDSDYALLPKTAELINDEWLIYSTMIFVKGPGFTYDDFTPEEIAALQKPALDAAEIANDAANNADIARENINSVGEAFISAETGRVSAENVRVSSETGRKNAESARVSAETGRVNAENAREIASATAVTNANNATNSANIAADNAQTEADNTSALNITVSQNEQTRVNSENARILAENGRHTAEDSRVLVEEGRVNAENAREIAESARVGAEESRESFETERVNKETARVSAENGRVSAENARVSAENLRKSAETAREGASATAVANANTAANTANTAATNADTARLEIQNNLNSKADKSVVDELVLGIGSYYIAGWNPNDLSPTPTTTKGNQAWMRDLSHVYLFDMTQNTGTTMRPVGELQRANWLRYVDGSFAPTVGITEAMRATCDVALYLDSAHTNQYSAAGAFNATTFYNTYGMNTPLYDINGNSVRILRPWETTNTNYTIGVGFSEKVWLIDGLGTSGTYWQGLSQHEITWDGVKGVPLERTAINPCPVTTYGNKTRCFFYLYNTGDSNTASAIGKNNLCTLFSGLGRTFPRVNDMQQVTNMNYARANNSVATNPYPTAEGGYHALNATITRREVLFGTRYLHNPALFGSGISSNDTCNNETTFLVNGGFKYKVSTDSTWNYCAFGATPTIYYNATAGTTNASDLLNQQYPKEQVLESQLAASFAKETGVSAGTYFSFYGSTYQWRNVTGVLGLADGRMNVIITKVMSQTISAFNAVGVTTNYDIACCLRMSIIDGINATGDIFMYSGGGYEQVGTCVSTVSPHTGDSVDLYLQPDQKFWTNTSDITKNNLGIFDFEKSYLKLATVTNLGDSYAKTRQSLTPWKIANGGGISTGQCFYVWDNNYWSTVLQQRVRIAARFRGLASISFCSPRIMYASYAVSFAYQSIGGSAQILIG
jgi:hypothetical protein